MKILQTPGKNINANIQIHYDNCCDRDGHRICSRTEEGADRIVTECVTDWGCHIWQVKLARREFHVGGTACQGTLR